LKILLKGGRYRHPVARPPQSLTVGRPLSRP
jgi:hypothetical protein